MGKLGGAFGPPAFFDTNMLVSATQKSVLPNAKPRHKGFHVAVEYRLLSVRNYPNLRHLKKKLFLYNLQINLFFQILFRK